MGAQLPKVDAKPSEAVENVLRRKQQLSPRLLGPSGALKQAAQIWGIGEQGARVGEKEGKPVKAKDGPERITVLSYACATLILLTYACEKKEETLGLLRHGRKRFRSRSAFSVRGSERADKLGQGL